MKLISALYYINETHIWIIFLVSFPILFLISPRLLKGLTFNESNEFPFYFPVLLGLISLLLCLALPIQYLAVDRFFDHAEAQIPAVAWLAMRGDSVYHSFDSNFLYSLFYGPYLYLIQGTFLKVFGTSFFVAKLPGVLSFFASLWLIYLSIRKLENRRHSFFMVCGAAVLLSQFGGYNFWVRSDPLILLCSSIAIYYSLGRSRVATVLGIGISFGVAVNLKITSAAYFFPIFSILLTRFGLLDCFLAGGIGAAIVAAPFFLPQISFPNYVSLLSLSKNQVSGLTGAFFLALIFLVYVSPALVTLGLELDAKKRSLGIRRWHLVSLVVAGVIISWAASRPGAGYWHFMPFFPVIFVFSSELFRKIGVLESQSGSASLQQRLMSSVFFALLGGVVPTVASKSFQAVTEIRAFRREAILSDFNQVEERHPGKSIGVLPGGMELYRLTFYRAYFVWKGSPYLIDPAALMELKFLGVGLDSKIISIIDQCSYQVALVPKDARPLEMISWYSGNSLLSSSVSEYFLKNYKKEVGTQYYDVYLCRKKDGPV